LVSHIKGIGFFASKVGDPKTVPGHVFYEWAQSYAALGRYCDAISPIEMYVSLDPVKRRTPQTTKVISEYAERGDCEKSYATGTVRVPFAVGQGSRWSTWYELSRPGASAQGGAVCTPWSRRQAWWTSTADRSMGSTPCGTSSRVGASIRSRAEAPVSAWG
jgi:hypothetical protein